MHGSPCLLICNRCSIFKVRVCLRLRNASEDPALLNIPSAQLRICRKPKFRTFAPVYQHPRHENRTSPKRYTPKNTDALRSARYRGGMEGIIGKERAPSHVGAATYQRPIAHCRLIWLHCLSNIPPACQPDMAARLRDGNGFGARISTEPRTAQR